MFCCRYTYVYLVLELALFIEFLGLIRPLPNWVSSQSLCLGIVFHPDSVWRPPRTMTSVVSALSAWAWHTVHFPIYFLSVFRYFRLVNDLCLSSLILTLTPRFLCLDNSFRFHISVCNILVQKCHLCFSNLLLLCSQFLLFTAASIRSVVVSVPHPGIPHCSPLRFCQRKPECVPSERDSLSDLCVAFQQLYLWLIV